MTMRHDTNDEMMLPNSARTFVVASLGCLMVIACGHDDPIAPRNTAGTVAYGRGGGGQTCAVVTARELMITDAKVVDDALRTTWATDPAVDPRAASWTFGRLMQKIAGPNDAQVMVRALLDSWLVDQVVNGHTVAARPKMATKVTNPWLTAGGGTLDLRKAPFLLSAIVNRMDLKDLSRQSAGEGRIVFSTLTASANGVSLPMTVIFEFNLPATSQTDVDQWAADWHALGALTIGSAAYNNALGVIVDRFATAGSLLRFLTNEAAFDPVTDNGRAAVQEFRQFKLNAGGDRLEIAPVELTPANALDTTATLANFINSNESPILAGSHSVPLTFDGAPFQGGAVFGPPNNEGATAQRGYWKAPGILNNDARHKFSVATCNGCHNLPETGTGAVHVFRSKTRTNKAAPAASLSGFLKGITVPDPVSGVTRAFNDLARRNAAFSAMVCS